MPHRRRSVAALGILSALALTHPALAQGSGGGTPGAMDHDHHHHAAPAEAAPTGAAPAHNGHAGHAHDVGLLRQLLLVQQFRLPELQRMLLQSS